MRINLLKKIKLVAGLLILIGFCADAFADDVGPGELINVASSPLNLTQNFSASENQSWFPFRKTGDRLYLNTPVVQDCLAMSWDGRLMICSHPQFPQVKITSPLLKKFEPGQFSLLAGQSLSEESLTLTLQADCNIVLTQQEQGTAARILWASGTDGKCKSNRFHLGFFPGGNLVLYDDTNPVWSTVTSPYLAGLPGELKGGAFFALFAGPPYIALLDENGKGIWTPTDALTRTWMLRLFLPERLRPTENPLQFTEQFKSSFSTTFPFAVPQGVKGESFPGNFSLASSMLGSIAIAADPQYFENPYRSDAHGKPLQTGAFLTYQLILYAPIYNSVGGSAPPLGQFKSTVIVAEPYTERAAVSRIALTSPLTPMKDVNGRPLVGIEPTLTADGQLIVYQNFSATDFGALYYSYNSRSGIATGWTAPKPITKINKDKTGDLGAKKYPLTRTPIVDGSGAAYSKPLLGAYPWLSLDGSELFFQAVNSNDGARRSAFSVVGSGTSGMVRLVDGGPNFTRDISKDSPIRRLTVISPGRSPGMWSPFEFQEVRTLPLTDKPYTYPLFTVSGAPAYFEVSLNETLAGNYDVFLDMAEVVNASASYHLNRLQDISGNFHFGVKNAGARSPEEAFPEACQSNSCPMNDPLSSAANLFSGKAVYFNDQGLITVKAKTELGHQILKGAKDLTLSLAILPLRELREGATNNYRSLLFKKKSFSLILEQERQLTFNLNVQSSKGKLTLSAPFWGPSLPLNQWTHIVLTFQSGSGALSYYVNGSLYRTQVFAEAKGAQIIEDTSALLIGPSPVKDPASPALAGYLFALDQIGVSSMVQPYDEILRQAGGIQRRLSRSQVANPLPAGLLIKDINQPILLNRPLDSHKVELGKELFFEPKLSANNQVSCSSCHLPQHGFAEPLSLHSNLLSNPPHLLRHTPGIQHVGLKSQFFLDGRAPTLIDQALAVLNNPQEMAPSLEENLVKLRQVPAYQNLFALAFPGQSAAINSDNVAKSLQEYQLSLMLQESAANSRFDRYRLGDLTALTDLENRGRNLFFGKARCSQCHTGSGLSDNLFHSLPFLGPKNQDDQTDFGKMQATNHIQDLFKFATPTLRNLSSTGPYFHNGSVDSLEGVVALYSSWSMASKQNSAKVDEAMVPIRLSAEEQAALVAFLKTLNSY